MKIIRGNHNLPKLEPSAVALGMFDGVHLGHKQILSRAIDYAGEHNLKSAAITLSNHPRALTQGEAPKLITDLESRLLLLERMGFDYVLVLDFNQQLMSMSAEDYLQNYIVDCLQAQFISIGYDHHFGAGRSGTPAMLAGWASKQNIGLHVLEAFNHNNYLVSSSLLRSLLEEGRVELVNELLGHRFFICGEVISGDGRGREIGFPTANVQYSDEQQILANGVYLSEIVIDGQVYPSVVNIGLRPTFNKLDKSPEKGQMQGLRNDENRSLLNVNEDLRNERNAAVGSFQAGLRAHIEVHVLGFDKDIYGKHIELSFIKKLRDEQKFDSVDLLIDQINKDIGRAKEELSAA